MAPSPNIPDEVDFSLYGGAETLYEGKQLLNSGLCKTEVQHNTNSKQESIARINGVDYKSTRRTVITNPHNPGDVYNVPPRDTSDFLWIMTEEPHRSRRMAIMKKHPEVRKLMGHEPLTKYVVTLVVLLQFTIAFALRNTHPLSIPFLLTAYIVGGTANHNLFLAIHEITHNLAFKGVKANKMFAIFANLPIGVPYAVTFKGYHLEHHKYQGEDGVDTDLPTQIELVLLNNVLGKVFFCTFQILFYALRPGFVRSQKPSIWHGINIATQLIFDLFLIVYFPSLLSALDPLISGGLNVLGGGGIDLMGAAGAGLGVTGGEGTRMLIYFIMSSFWAGSLHPLAGHFIAEHYVWDGLDQETYSYYGWLNWFAYNVGYHNEHHDFPSVPWTRLPTLRALAPEFYDNLPSHPSWPMITVNFIRDPNVGIWARVKRPGREVREKAKRDAEEVKGKEGKGELEDVELDGGCADEPAMESGGVKRE